MYLCQGHFEESLGNLDAARYFYKHVYENIVPGLFDGIFRHLNLERKAKNYELVETLYALTSKIALESGQDTLKMFVSNHYAHYQLYTNKNPEKMIEIYENALKDIKSKKSLYLVYIHSLSQVKDQTLRMQNTKKTYEMAIGEESEVIFIYECNLTEVRERG